MYNVHLYFSLKNLGKNVCNYTWQNTIYTWVGQEPQIHHLETLALILSFLISVIHIATHPHSKPIT